MIEPCAGRRRALGAARPLRLEFGIVKIMEVVHEGRAGKAPPHMLEFITSFGDGDDVAVFKTNESLGLLNLGLFAPDLRHLLGRACPNRTFPIWASSNFASRNHRARSYRPQPRRKASRQP